MLVRKRNEFLEEDESDSELENGYDSDKFEESRGTIGGRKNKRRRVEQVSDDESLNGLEQDETGDHKADESFEAAESNGEAQDQQNLKDDSKLRDHKTLDSLPAKTSTPKEVAKAQRAAKKSGVIYISRIPPFMKPQPLRHFLTPHAPKGLGRLFLTPEDPTTHKSRVRNGGNKKKSFTDGWVECISKRDAKRIVETLNGSIVGGKKGGWFHDDVWSMRYLKGFKWENLTEQIANENAERAARLREEVRRTREENRAFVEDVERGKMISGIERKRKDGGKGKVDRKESGKGFKQKAVQRERRVDEGNGGDAAVERLRGMVFG